MRLSHHYTAFGLERQACVSHSQPNYISSKFKYQTDMKSLRTVCVLHEMPLTDPRHLMVPAMWPTRIFCLQSPVPSRLSDSTLALQQCMWHSSSSRKIHIRLSDLETHHLAVRLSDLETLRSINYTSSEHAKHSGHINFQHSLGQIKSDTVRSAIWLYHRSVYVLKVSIHTASRINTRLAVAGVSRVRVRV